MTTPVASVRSLGLYGFDSSVVHVLPDLLMLFFFSLLSFICSGGGLFFFFVVALWARFWRCGFELSCSGSDVMMFLIIRMEYGLGWLMELDGMSCWHLCTYIGAWTFEGCLAWGGMGMEY
jgi:hypothetical protein